MGLLGWGWDWEGDPSQAQDDIVFELNMREIETNTPLLRQSRCRVIAELRGAWDC